MNKLYLAVMQRISQRSLARQPEMDILMMDHSQNAEYSRDGEEGSLAIIYDLIVNAILRLSPPSGRALDICCGSASLLCRIASAMPNMQFLGVDLSENMLAFAHEHRAKYQLKNLNFQKADMYRLTEVLQPPFDLITWHLAMHHCDDAESVIKVLNQIPKLLKPGGTLFVFDINRPKTGHLALLMADIFNRRQGDWFYQDSLDSYKAAFSYEEVQDILKRCDLKGVRHVQPVISNFFQAFYISQTNNAHIAQVANLKQFWQKMDYALMKSSFAALPLASEKAINSRERHATTHHVNPNQPHKESQEEQDTIAILDIGTRAMSAYNLQPWRFRIEGEWIFIHFIRRKNFFLKLEGVYYIMIGHLLANIMAGAKAKNYRAEYHILSEALSIDQPCVKLRFIKDQGTASDISHVLDRTTNRYHYSTQKLDPSIKQEILSLNDDDNITIQFLEDREKAEVAAILTDLESVRLTNTKLTHEAIAFIRFDEKDIENNRDYLEVKSLNFRPIVATLLSHIKNFPFLFTILKISGGIRPVTTNYNNLLNHSAAIMTFILNRRGYQDFIKLGIVVQNIANQLSQKKAASMALLSGLYLADVLSENPEILSNDGKNIILRSIRKLTELLKIREQRLSYIMRVGYTDQSPPKTVRKNIRDLIYYSGQRIDPS